MKPGLAESWKRISPETVEFKLRKGVKFHEGQTLTAKDVAFSLNRALEPSSQFKNNMLGIKSAKALDDYTVLVETVSATPVFFRQLIDVRIINYEWAKAHGALHPQNASANEESFMARHANGTGPFKLESREVDVKVDYVGFDVPNEFLVGYGLDYASKYRNLPYIGILKPEVYTKK